jgi:mRNA-degrading endonuclease RelE of RelBE toxin-antitoxin system
LVLSTSIFEKALSDLVKKPRDGYSNCLNDIIGILCSLSFVEICNLDDVVTRMQDVVIRKVRIPNSEKSWGKSQGYRLILLCNITEEKIFLLFVYPKKGRLESSDLTSKGAELLIDEFIKINKSGEIFVPICKEAETEISE